MSRIQATLKKSTTVALLAMAAMLTAGSQLSAQPDHNNAIARVYGAYNAPDACSQNQDSPTMATAAASCPLSGVIASGSASATATSGTRTGTASGSISATGLQGSGVPYGGAAATTAERKITFSDGELPTNLVFEYAVTHAEGASGGALAYGESEMFLYDAISNPAIVWTARTDGPSSMSMGSGVTTSGFTSDGSGIVRFSVAYTGGDPYWFSTYVQGDGWVNNYTHDLGETSAFGSITATLNRVYATNGDWTSADAMFDDVGNGVIQSGPVTTTPEPSSLALLGTGLFGLAPMIRKRRN